jgi:tetrahydromethanopterin S-methyltransferase subunit D
MSWMGRIGAGEAATLVFALALPLLHFGGGISLVSWGRRAMRARRRFGAPAFYAAATGLGLMLTALLATAVQLIGVFGDVAHAPVAERSVLLARGISESMNLTALGVVISVALYALSFVLLLLSRRSPVP